MAVRSLVLPKRTTVLALSRLTHWHEGCKFWQPYRLQALFLSVRFPALRTGLNSASLAGCRPERNVSSSPDPNGVTEHSPVRSAGVGEFPQPFSTLKGSQNYTCSFINEGSPPVIGAFVFGGQLRHTNGLLVQFIRVRTGLCCDDQG